MGRFFGSTSICVGDRVVFRLTRHAARPGVAARNVTPSEKGEGYSYVVNKFWVVVATNKSTSILVRTRRGKVFEIDRTDSRLRRASWLECLFARSRLPEAVIQEDQDLLMYFDNAALMQGE
ncbi:MAG: hypothetical protein H8E66_26035 [Planctomycetes bacterium]|nr:hypothetical protein [Planctomycetota bacterium]